MFLMRSMKSYDKKGVQINYNYKLVYYQSMFNSDRKATQRNSILKNNKATATTNNKKTQPGHSVKFRDHLQVQQSIKEFTDNASNQKQNIKQITNSNKSYQSHFFAKDISYLNSIYNHVLVTISSQIKDINNEKNAQVVKMSNQIKRVILENIGLKEELDAKYRSMTNLQEIAQYLDLKPEALKKGEALKTFINDFETKQKQAQRLSKQLRIIQEKASVNRKNSSPQKLSQKQEKCKALRKQINKQAQKIKNLQADQKYLLKKLYATQKSILKNENSHSQIRLKYMQAEGDKTRRASKAKQQKQMGKQNQPFENKKQRKSMKIQANQKPKQSKSLAKLLRYC